MKKLISLLLVAVLVSAVFAVTVTAENTDKWAGKLTIDLSDNEQLLNIDEEAATKLLTDGDWALNAEGWGGKHDGVVLVQNKNATNPDAYGMVNLIWEFDETPEAYNTIKFGLYTDVNSMIGYPTEEDVYFSNDGEEWVSGYYDLGYGEIIPDAVYGGDNQTAPGTVVADIRLENPQTYKFIKIEFYYPKSPFEEKPRWEFFGLTEVFAFDNVEVSSVITDFNATEYWESRYGRGAGSFAFTTAEDYKVAWDNFITADYTQVAFAPVADLENVYEVTVIGNSELTFPEGGFIWVAYNGAEAGSAAKAALDLFATMTVGEQYTFTGIDFEKGFGASDAKVEKYVPSVDESNGDESTGDESTGDESTGDEDASVEDLMKEALGTAFADAKLDYVIDAPETYKAGDEITVTVTVKNITAETGVHIVEFALYYDNEKLLLTNDLDEDDNNALVCFEELPSKWENFSRVNNDDGANSEDGTVLPLNDGKIICSVLTDNPAEKFAVKEDDVLVFTFNFKVLDDAEGDIGLVIPHAEAEGAINTDTGADVYKANGDYAVIAEATTEPDVSEPETSDPAVSEPETSGSEDTKPGDASSMIIFAILAIVALAGSAVVIKNRK